MRECSADLCYLIPHQEKKEIDVFGLKTYSLPDVREKREKCKAHVFSDLLDYFGRVWISVSTTKHQEHEQNYISLGRDTYKKCAFHIMVSSICALVLTYPKKS